MVNNILINGEAGDAVPFQDRGLHYGDGLFETIAIKDGELLCLNEHLERLMVSCKRLGIPFSDIPLLTAEAKQSCGNIKQGILKIIITRGEGGRGYAPPADVSPTRIVATYPWPDFSHINLDEGVATRVCKTRYGHNPVLAGMKHLNRLEQVLARSEWDSNNYLEGIVLDIEDNVIEGTMSNIFFVSEGMLCTPDLSQCGINGVIRQLIIDLRGDVAIKTVTRDELLAADEVFLCNSVIGIWPVSSIDDTTFPVGPVTGKTALLLRKQQLIA